MCKKRSDDSKVTFALRMMWYVFGFFLSVLVFHWILRRRLGHGHLLHCKNVSQKYGGSLRQLCVVRYWNCLNLREHSKYRMSCVHNRWGIEYGFGVAEVDGRDS